MPPDAYFEGPSYDFFVKPMIFGDSAGGEPSRWVASSDETPDAWTVYALDMAVALSAKERIALSDHMGRQAAIAEAERHHKQDKLAHLLGARYDPSTGRIHMP